MQINPDDSVSLLKEHQVAKALAISVDTVRRWRVQGKGPTWIRVGGAVRYRTQDFLVWLGSRPTGGEQIQEAKHV